MRTDGSINQEIKGKMNWFKNPRRVKPENNTGVFIHTTHTQTFKIPRLVKPENNMGVCTHTAHTQTNLKFTD